MKRLITALVCLSLPASASAAGWVSVADCGDPGELRAYSYDPGSIKKDGANRSVKIRGDYSQHATSKAREAMMLWSFDCATRTFTERSRTEYGKGLKVIENYKKPTSTMAVNADSVADKVFAVVCA